MRNSFPFGSLLGESNPLYKYPLLYEAAVDEFSRKKWEDASLNDILRNAGMSKGSFYYNFGDKFGLYLAVADRIIQKKKSFFAPLAKEGFVNEDFFQFIKALSRRTMEFMYQDQRLYHMTNRILEESPGWIEKLKTYLGLYDIGGGFLPLIEKAIAEGQISGEYPAAFVSGIIGILFSNLHRLTGTGGAQQAFATLEKTVDMMQNGLAPVKQTINESEEHR